MTHSTAQCDQFWTLNFQKNIWQFCHLTNFLSCFTSSREPTSACVCVVNLQVHKLLSWCVCLDTAVSGGLAGGGEECVGGCVCSDTVARNENIIDDDTKRTWLKCLPPHAPVCLFKMTHFPSARCLPFLSLHPFLSFHPHTHAHTLTHTHTILFCWNMCVCDFHSINTL